MPNKPLALWDHAVENLNTWKCEGVRAPHKPLLILMLIARAERGADRHVRFREIEKQLRHLIKQFGPPRSQYHPEYPFWHLRNDGIWIIQDVERIPLRKQGHNPSAATLRKLDVEGAVPEGLWRALTRNAVHRRRLAWKLLEEFWPPTQHAAICNSVGIPEPSQAASTRRLRDPRFREEVLRAYERCCAVCGYDGRLGDNLLGIDAAHVRWHAYGGPDSVANGLALCCFHHTAVDAGAVGFTEDRRILISSDVTGYCEVDVLLRRHSGRALRVPQPGWPALASEFIKWHHDEVFKGPARGGAYSIRPASDSLAADSER